MNVTLSDYLITFDNVLEKEFCEHVCERMKNDKRKSIGVVGRAKDVNTKVKNSIDLHISPLADWKEEDNVFFKSLSEKKDEYMPRVEENTGINTEFLLGHPYAYGLPDDVWTDTGYQVKEYTPGGRYNWHHDYTIEAREGPRILTYIWYLNTDFDGGETEFIDGTIIKPEVGKMLIFPANWLFVHRGKLVSNGHKYIATGWFHHQHPTIPKMYTNG